MTDALPPLRAWYLFIGIVFYENILIKPGSEITHSQFFSLKQGSYGLTKIPVSGV